MKVCDVDYLRLHKLDAMDSSAAKRRKMEHSKGASFPSSISPRSQRATPFVMETDELLKEVKLDYGKTLEGADELLHKLKRSIEEMQPHGPIPVRSARPFPSGTKADSL